jgi:hypothetical protein
MSKLFTEKNRAEIERNVIEVLNSSKLMSKNTVNSPRAVGDAVQEYLEEHFVNCVPKGLIADFNANFARRSMADFAFTDIEDHYYVVDNKTHNLGTQFNMPNLTSVERLARFYGDHNNFFTLLLVSYNTEGTELIFSECTFAPIEMLDWSCLTLGALGWGQIQIANSNIIKTNTEYSRKKWMLELCDALEIFYPNEITKIAKRLDYFKKIREFWNNQPDN